MIRKDLISQYAALALLGAASTALAQTAPTPPQAAESSELQEIVVTGSLIKRTNAETAEAVTIVKMDALKDMGVTSVEQALALVTANNASQITTSSNVAYFNGGASFASLRGLGGIRTLVLLDGERLASNVINGGAVDLNTIPFAAIDHIEVLREGASSEYGSDAIAGVVNFITKKDYDGGEVNVNYSRPQHPGGATDNVDLTYGIGNLASDGYNLMITGNVASQQELVAAQRGFASTGYDPAASLANFNGPYGPWPGSYQDANNSLWQVGYPQCAGNPHLAAVNGSCQYEYSAAVDLIPASKQQSGLISFTKSLPGNNALSIQYFYGRFDLQTWGGPQEYFFTVDPSSPYYPTAAESTCVGTCATPTPALGAPVPAGWTDPNNNRYFENVNTEQRALLTFRGSNAGWDYATTFDWSQNKGVQQVRGGEANYALLAPGGTLSNLINPFGPQSAAGQALINGAYTQGDLEIGTLSLYELGAHATHALGDMFDAGRPAAFAFGVDYKDEEITNQPTPLATTLYTATYYPPLSITGSRVSEAAYVEVNIPVSKDAEISVSDRQDRYSDFGTTNNAKFKFDYQPFSFLKIRGAASTGFRAPSLVNLYSPQTFGATQGNMNGPGCASGNYTTVFSQLNCISQGLAVYGGNPNLTPETSQNFDLGFIVEPIANLGITVDYYRVIVKNSIGQVPPPAIYTSPTTFAADYVLNNAGTLSPASASNLECPTPKAATCGYIIDTFANTGGTVTDGFDLSVNYLINTDVGKFRVGLEGTFVTDFKVQQYTGGPEVNLLGSWSDYTAPVIRWQHLLTVDWTYQNVGAGLSNQFTEHYGDEYPNAAGNPITVSNYSLWNGYVSYSPIAPLKLLLGINNILDTNPPFSNQNGNWQSGYSPIESSPLGRTFYVKATYKF
jgi:iron complex outermembrane recepter protein